MHLEDMIGDIWKHSVPLASLDSFPSEPVLAIDVGGGPEHVYDGHLFKITRGKIVPNIGRDVTYSMDSSSLGSGYVIVERDQETRQLHLVETGNSLHLRQELSNDSRILVNHEMLAMNELLRRAMSSNTLQTY